ncbi:hypothetical protein Tco_0462243 [Tanacetum coccineum]
MGITATIDGKVKIVTEASIRRHLKLEDSDGISIFPTTEIFEQLALMGYVSNSDKLTFQKGHFSLQWIFLIHTILHCLSSKKTVWEQFSSNIATALICLATNRKFNFSKLIFDGMMKNLDSKTKFLMYLRFIQIFLYKPKRLLLPYKRTYIAPTHTQKLFSNIRRASKGYTGVDILLFPTMLVQGQIVQGEGSIVPVESYHTPTGAPSISPLHLSPTPRISIRQETKIPQFSYPPHTNVADEAASTGVDVRHRGAATTITSLDVGHGSGNIDKTPTMPHDLPLPRVDTLGSDDDLKQTKQVYGAAYTKLIMKDKEFDLDFNAAKEVSTAEDVSTAKPVSTAGGAAVTAAKDKFEINQDPDIFIPALRLSPFCFILLFILSQSIIFQQYTTLGASVSTASASSAKDKGKGIMTESEPVQTKTKLQQEQERLGYEAAVRLQEELDEEERQRMTRVYEAAQSFTKEEWENIRARVEADEELTQRLQAEERNKYSEVDQAKMLVDLINQRKRYFAAQKAKAKRNKPMTQA